MPGLSWVVLVAILGVACTGIDRSSLPTAPSALGASSAGGSVRIEHWTLTLKIRDVMGIECDVTLDGTRSVDLRVEFAEGGTVAMRYSQPTREFADAAAVTGWTIAGGFEGAGVAYEGLPCSGAAQEPTGAPTTLTGYFSDDNRTFQGVEVRRYMGRPDGDIVYHVEWKAQKQ
jgi:hypothetical protein